MKSCHAPGHYYTLGCLVYSADSTQDVLVRQPAKPYQKNTRMSINVRPAWTRAAACLFHACASRPASGIRQISGRTCCSEPRHDGCLTWRHA